MEILIWKKYRENADLVVRDTYIIHKPNDLDETPGWVRGMNVYDGRIIEIVGKYYETINYVYWKARPIDYVDCEYSFNINWLELAYYDELSVSDVDFFSI